MNQVFRVIESIKKQHPELRIAQIVSWAGDSYYLSDEQLATEIMKAYSEYYAKEQTNG